MPSVLDEEPREDAGGSEAATGGAGAERPGQLVAAGRPAARGGRPHALQPGVQSRVSSRTRASSAS